MPDLLFLNEIHEKLSCIFLFFEYDEKTARM